MHETTQQETLAAAIAQKKADFYSRHATKSPYSERSYLDSVAFDVYNHLMPDELWLTDFPEMAIEVGKVIGGDRKPDTKRFLEGTNHLYRLSKDKGFEVDLNQYCQLVIGADKNFGRYTRGWFVTRFSDAMHMGISPQEYYNLVDDAVKKGGRKLAGHFLSSWGKMFESNHEVYGQYIYKPKNIDPKEVLSGVLKFSDKIRGQAKLRTRLLRVFLNSAIAVTLSGEANPIEFADKAADILSNFGEKAGFTVIWSYANLNKLSDFDFTPDEYLQVVARVLNQHSISAARWYAYGIGRLAENLDVLDRNISQSQKHINNVGETKDEDTKDFQKYVEELKRQRLFLDPLGYTRRYLSLLEKAGTGAAVLYALVASDRHSSILYSLEGQAPAFVGLYDKILNLKQRVPGRLFREATWFLGKFSTNPFWMCKYIDSLIRVYDKLGDVDTTINRLRYAAAAAKKGAYINEDLIPLNQDQIAAMELRDLDPEVQPPSVFEEESGQPPENIESMFDDLYQ